MTTEQWLLTTLAEECAEVAQRCSKAIRFGLKEVQPGQEKNNTKRLYEEIADLFGTIEYIENLGIMDGPVTLKPLIDRKFERLAKYLKYARELGIVND